jgi:hypothetical protein
VLLYAFEGALGYHLNAGVFGFVLGFALASYLGVIWYMVSVYSGATTWLTGASAEKWTDKELVALGPEWEIFRNVPFLIEGDGAKHELDIDHIAIGPQAVLVVESKYSSATLNLDSPDDKYVRQAIHQTHLNALRIRRLLSAQRELVPVIPLLVYWSRTVSSPERIVNRVDDVRIVHGGDGAKWRHMILARNRATPDAVAEAVRLVQQYVQERKY